MQNSFNSARDGDESASKFGLFVGILFIFLCGVSIGHCWWIGDVVAMVSVGFISLGCFLGYCLGLWRTIGPSVSASLGFLLAERTSPFLIPIVEKQLGQTFTASTGMLVSGLAVAVLVSLVFWTVRVFVIRKSRLLKSLDQYTGFLFGFGNSVAVVALFLWGLIASEPAIMQLRHSKSHGSDRADQLVRKLDEVLVATKRSYVMFALERWNPFFEVPQFRELKHQFDALIAKRASREADYSPLNAEKAETDPGLQKLIQTMFKGQSSGVK